MKFSIIIPCKNEIFYIRKCLESLRNLKYDRENFEIIVVDNGSTDGSEVVAQELADSVLVKPDIKVGGVRNQGAKQASGDWLIFIDSDCLVDMQWLSRAEYLIRSKPYLKVFGGGCVLPDNPGWIERLWLLEGAEGNQLPMELIGCSILINKKTFSDIGGFNFHMASGEDTEFSKRLKKTGQDIHITRDLNVIHLGNAKDLKSFIKRQVWHAEIYKNKRKDNIKDPIYIISIIFLSLLFLSFLSLIFNFKSFLIFTTLLFITPSILTLKRFLRAKTKPRPTELPLAYFLDLLYLTGRTIGLIKTL